MKMDTLSSTEFYDRLARVFDVMTDWRARLAFEMPFLRQTLDRYHARSVLDVACGTGWHVIALAQAGFAAAGCDASAAMIERARANARQAQVEARFEVAELSNLGAPFGGTFDAVLCLGNSLPHLLSQEALASALKQMRSRLRSGGVMILHNLNYDLRVKTQPRFFAPSGNADVLVWRFADYAPEASEPEAKEPGFITFHTALFERKASALARSTEGWTAQVNSTLQRPLLARDLDGALAQAEFDNVQHFGGLGLESGAFDANTSGDLVIVAEVK